MSTTDLSGSHRVVLPPIISSERDRVFLHQLTSFIDGELRSVDVSNPHELYTIYRAAFDKVIEHVTAYKPVLTALKAEYEECIDTVIRGKEEAVYLNGKLKAMASEASTVRNYKKRCDELMDRINIVRGNNDILSDEIRLLRADRLPPSSSSERDSVSSSPDKPAASRTPDRRLIPGLSIEPSTDPELLETESNRLQLQLKELLVARHIQYQPKNKAEQLKIKVGEKERVKEQCARNERELKCRLAKLQVCYEAAKAYNDVAGPYTQESIGDVIVETLRRYRKGHHRIPEQPVTGITRVAEEKSEPMFEDDDPVKEREADAIMDYIHKFNQLYDSEQFSAAAVHAANSPQGILRTMKTLQKFKATGPGRPNHDTPLLQFCQAAVSACGALKVKLSPEMASECVRCVLDSERLDLLQHWVGHQLFTATEELGEMISEHCSCSGACLCGCQSMAESMFLQAQCSFKAVECMLRQGRNMQAYRYGKHSGCFSRDTLVNLIRQYGNEDFVRLLLFPAHQEALVPVGGACKALIDKGLSREACDILDEVYKEDQGPELIDAEMDSGTVLTEDDWWTIGLLCRHNGLDDVSTHVMAAITVRSALKTAMILIRGSNI